MVVVWSKSAEAELIKAYDYIFVDSPQNAKFVVETLVDLSLDLTNHPNMYPPDKFKKNNEGNWRAFEKFHYRISYRVFKDKIRIVRMRHTSRPPLKY